MFCLQWRVAFKQSGKLHENIRLLWVAAQTLEQSGPRYCWVLSRCENVESIYHYLSPADRHMATSTSSQEQGTSWVSTSVGPSPFTTVEEWSCLLQTWHSQQKFWSLHCLSLIVWNILSQNTNSCVEQPAVDLLTRESRCPESPCDFMIWLRRLRAAAGGSEESPCWCVNIFNCVMNDEKISNVGCRDKRFSTLLTNRQT